jgi:hypothetical protein
VRGVPLGLERLKLYALLAEKMERFCTHERLQEMAHTLDTNMNEAFNQICTWYAPKNKVFAGTCSLPNRIGFAVGINSLGVEVFFKRLFKMMGIPVTSNVAYYLHLKEKSRVKRLAKLKFKESKVKRNKRKMDALTKNTLIAKMELRKREGTYRRGMNLDDPLEEADEANKMVLPAKRAKSTSSARYCEWCGSKGHITKRSIKCTAKASLVKLFNKEDGSLLSSSNSNLPLGAALEPAVLNEAANLAAEDCDNMDSLPFDHHYDSEEERPAPFFDEEDSDDDSVGIIRAAI